MIGKRLPSLGAVILLALLVAALLSGDGDDGPEPGGRFGGKPPAHVPPAPGGHDPVVPVLDVTDGDTIEVELDGVEENVRYIGVDTPEVDPSIGVECFGSDASAFNRELVGGREVRLVFDAERRDRYGRLLAYIYRRPDDLFVNAKLVREGYARTLTIEPNDSFAGLLDRLERAAANAGRGLWGEC